VSSSLYRSPVLDFSSVITLGTYLFERYSYVLHRRLPTANFWISFSRNFLIQFFSILSSTTVTMSTASATAVNPAIAIPAVSVSINQRRDA
jgi:hypothetical protein